MAPDRVLIRDTDHLAHFAADLSASYSSSAFADVVLRCANQGPSASKGAKARKASYPTLRVHRTVLASMSDFMANLIKDFPIEEDVHITLDQTAFEVAKRIVEFAYAGEVKIAKTLVTSVCDAAHRLQIKFLKDSFVKVTDKDYAAMKAGRKTLESIQKESKGAVILPTSPLSPFKQPVSPAAKKKVVKIAAAAPVGKAASSDTDSADSDEESRNAKAAGAKDGSKTASKPPAKGRGSKKKADTVMFTLTKQGEEGPSSKKPADTFLVHFNQKPENQKPIAVAPRTIIPSSVASIQQPLPPSALPKVKKVMIPPMMRKPVGIALPKNASSPPTFSLAPTSRVGKVLPAGPELGSPGAPQQLLNLNAFQVQTITQSDGSQIQVLKPPSGTIMKQLKSTNAGNTAVATRVITPSHVTPKDAIATALETISRAGPIPGIGKASIALQLPKNPVPMTKVALPTSPIPVAGISLPAKPLPVSAISGLKTVSMSPKKPILPSAIVKPGGSKVNPPIAILHPPGYLPTSRPANSSVIKVTSMPVSTGPVGPGLALQSTSSRLGVSQPKLGIPSTVPDDFLEDPSETKAVNPSAVLAPKGKRGGGRAKGATAAKKNAAPAVVKSQTPAKGVPEVDSSLTRSSGRARKVNPKYNEGKGKRQQEVKKAATTAPPENSRKRKAVEKAGPPAKKVVAAAKVNNRSSNNARSTPARSSTLGSDNKLSQSPFAQAALELATNRVTRGSKTPGNNDDNNHSKTKPVRGKAAASAKANNAAGSKRSRRR